MALLQISDEVVLRYVRAAQEARIPLDRLIERTLSRMVDTPITSRVVLLDQETCARLDRLLGIGSTKDAPSLIAAVERWAGITIGDIRLDFSPAQLAEITVRAEKQGKTSQEVVEDLVAQLQDSLFYGPVVAR